MNFKENDVFKFQWNESETSRNSYPYHCFDGTLIVKKYNGDLYLEDTYWSGGENKIFKKGEVHLKGKLTFLCNLDEVIEIKSHETVYYDDLDIVYLHIHGGHRSKYLLKKGSQRSRSKMLDSIKYKIEAEESKIKSAENSLKYHKETLLKIENGDTSVWI